MKSARLIAILTISAMILCTLLGCSININPSKETTSSAQVETSDTTEAAATESTAAAEPEGSSEATSEASEETSTAAETTTEAGSTTKITDEDSIQYRIISDSSALSDEKLGKNLIELDYDHIEITSPGYYELQSALENEYAIVSQDAGMIFTNDCLDYMPEITSEEDYEAAQLPWYYYHYIDVYRSDPVMFSYLNNLEEYRGGVRPSSTTTGVNIDSQTGRDLGLWDVIRNRDKLYLLTYDKLQQYQDKNGDLIDDWETALVRAFSETSPGFSWVAGKDYIELWFGEYTLAPGNAGEIYVTLYVENAPDMFDMKYFEGATGGSKDAYSPEDIRQQIFEADCHAGICYLGYFAGPFDTMQTLIESMPNGQDYMNWYPFVADVTFDRYFEQSTMFPGMDYFYILPVSDECQISINSYKDGSFNEIIYKSEEGLPVIVGCDAGASETIEVVIYTPVEDITTTFELELEYGYISHAVGLFDFSIY